MRAVLKIIPFLALIGFCLCFQSCLILYRNDFTKNGEAFPESLGKQDATMLVFKINPNNTNTFLSFNNQLKRKFKRLFKGDFLFINYDTDFHTQYPDSLKYRFVFYTLEKVVPVYNRQDNSRYAVKNRAELSFYVVDRVLQKAYKLNYFEPGFLAYSNLAKTYIIYLEKGRKKAKNNFTF